MRIRLASMLAGAALLACSGEGGNPLGPLSPAPLPAIVDATNGGRAGFYFLSPIVDNPGVSGPFDGTIAPRARICALNAARTACQSTLATIVKGSGPDALKVEGSGSFTANWSSPGSIVVSSTSGTGTRYRLEIELDVGGSPVILGYADIWVGDKQKDVKDMPSGFIGLVRGKKLQIRFGVLPATVSHVLVTPNPATVNVGGTQQMTATAYDTHNTVIAGATFAWSSDNGSIAAVSASGLATGIANGTTNINATTGGVTGSAVINVIGTPPAAPSAVNDAPAPASAPGDPFHGAFNTALSSGGTTPNVLANDDRGSPLATVVSFGGGDLGGALTDNAAGATATFGTGGSVQVNADGSFTFTPSGGFTGEFSFSYRIQNASGFSDASVTIAVGARPSASDDTYPTTVIGNVSINTASSSGFSVLGNDAGSGLTIALGSSPNGNTSINANGTFTFNPSRGFTGTATFTYTVQNGFGTSTVATVSIPVTTPIWFVDASAPAGGDGRLSTPFNCLVDAGTACYDNAPNDPGDHLYIASGSYANSSTLFLAASQRVVGQGAASSLAMLTGLTNAADSPALPATGGSPPHITSAADGIFVFASNSLYGFNVGNTIGAGIVGSSIGTLTVQDVSLPGPTRSGPALSLSSGAFAVGSSFGTIVSTSGAATGVSLTSVGGNLTVTGGTTIQNSTSYGIHVLNGTAGTINFGNTTVTGTGDIAVRLNSNATNVMFSSLDASAAAGKSALESLNSTGTITTSSGALSASNAQTMLIDGLTGVTPLSMVLTSVSANGGGGSGMFIARTSGSLSVTGTGTASSGGTIENVSGNGITLVNAPNVSVAWILIQNNLTNGINGSGASGFSMDRSTVLNNGNGFSEHGINLSAMTGSASITNSTISNSWVDNARIESTTGSLALTFTGNNVSNDATRPSGLYGVAVEGKGTASITATVTNNTFQGHRQSHILLLNSSTGTMNGTVTGNTLTCGNALAQLCNLSLAQNANGTFNYLVQNNLITGALAAGTAALAVEKLGAGTMTGSILNNTIGISGVAGSGATGSGITAQSRGTGGSHVVSIANNAIRRYVAFGLILRGMENSSLSATVTGNVIEQPDAFFSTGLILQAGLIGPGTATSCLSMSGNSLNSSAGAVGFGFDLQQSLLTTIRLPGYVGANNDNAAVVNFVRPSQTGATPVLPTGSASNNAAGGGGGFVGGAACATPP